MAANPMDGLADMMNKLSTEMRQVADGQREHSRQMEELKQKVQEHEQQLSQALAVPEGGGRSQTPKRPRLALSLGTTDEGSVALPPDTDLTQVATKQDVVELINTSIREIVVPNVNHELHKVDRRCSQLEDEIRTMKMRVAWCERDVLQMQTEAAKKQIVMRNWPDDSTEKQRFLTVEGICNKVNIWPNTVVLATPTYETYDKDDEGKWVRKLSPISILTVQSFADRQAILRACGKFADYVESKEAYDTNQIPQWHLKKIKMAPGITQMERRLEAPLQGLMNAYQRAFRAYKGRSFRPLWKTLTVTDDQGAWMGRINYKRKPIEFATEAQMVSTAGNWICEIQLPAELEKEIITGWNEVWSEQKQKQVELTDAEDAAMEKASKSTDPRAKHYMQVLGKPRPQWDENTQLGVDAWKMRFAWEFPWPTVWTLIPKGDERRSQYTDLPTVEDLMKEMSAEAHVAAFDAPQAAAAYQPDDAEGDQNMTGSAEVKESEAAGEQSATASQSNI